MRKPSPGINRCICLGTRPVRWWSADNSMRTSQQLQRIGISGRGLVVALPYLWLMLFFVVPFVIVLKISFSDIDLAIPPYKPLLEWIGKNALAIKVNFNNYAFLFTDSLYIHAFLNSIKVAFISTLLCLL